MRLYHAERTLFLAFRSSGPAATAFIRHLLYPAATILPLEYLHVADIFKYQLYRANVSSLAQYASP